MVEKSGLRDRATNTQWVAIEIQTPKEPVIAFKDDDPDNVGVVLCKVLGCPRTTEEGYNDENAACVLLTWFGPGEIEEHPNCSTTMTLDLWEKHGLIWFA